MTDPEKKALNDARKILLLHFPAFIILARASDENNNDTFPADWHGSISDVMGLTMIARKRLEDIVANPND